MNRIIKFQTFQEIGFHNFDKSDKFDEIDFRWITFFDEVWKLLKLFSNFLRFEISDFIKIWIFIIFFQELGNFFQKKLFNSRIFMIWFSFLMIRWWKIKKHWWIDRIAERNLKLMHDCEFFLIFFKNRPKIDPKGVPGGPGGFDPGVQGGPRGPGGSGPAYRPPRGSRQKREVLPDFPILREDPGLKKS